MAQRYNRTLILRMILKTREMGSLEDIQEALFREGYKVSLGTISNDLRQLRVAKVKTTTGQRYILPDNPLYQRILDDDGPTPSLRNAGFKRITFSGNLAVMHTEKGYATAIGADIDAAELNAVAGTVAGIDTLLIVIAEGVPRREFIEALSTIVPAVGKVGAFD